MKRYLWRNNTILMSVLGWKSPGECQKELSRALEWSNAFAGGIAIRGFKQQLREVAKTVWMFLADERLLKMLYLAMMDITQK